jgi:hypothetical protein
MTTVLIVVCIVLCIGVFVAIVGHLGHGIAEDRSWRARMSRRRWTRGKAAAKGSRREPRP